MIPKAEAKAIAPVEIMFPQILDVGLKTKRDKDEGLITQLTFDVKAAPGDLARLFNMARQSAPMVLTVSTTQLQFDLEISMVKRNEE